MAIGLFFFIRASVKDRTKQIQLVPSESEDMLIEKLRQYFEGRAYQLTAIDSQKKQVALKGFVRPSLFLAVLLSLLALVGLSCLVLVLLLLFPETNKIVGLLVLIAPLAGNFYWRKAGRWEKIILQVITKADSPNIVAVTAHRDELIQLQENLSVQTID
jgi:hypothetical protein